MNLSVRNNFWKSKTCLMLVFLAFTNVALVIFDPAIFFRDIRNDPFEENALVGKVSSYINRRANEDVILMLTAM